MASSRLPMSHIERSDWIAQVNRDVLVRYFDSGRHVLRPFMFDLLKRAMTDETSDMLAWMHTRGMFLEEPLISWLNFKEWFLKNAFKFTTPVLRWLHTTEVSELRHVTYEFLNSSFVADSFLLACSVGNLDNVQFFASLGGLNRSTISSAIRVASVMMHPHVLQWLLAQWTSDEKTPLLLIFLKCLQRGSKDAAQLLFPHVRSLLTSAVMDDFFRDFVSKHHVWWMPTEKPRSCTTTSALFRWLVSQKLPNLTHRQISMMSAGANIVPSSSDFVSPDDAEDCVSLACITGSVESLDWLLTTHDITVSEKCLKDAIWSDSMVMLDYLLTTPANFQPVADRLLLYALNVCSFSAASWLLSHVLFSPSTLIEVLHKASEHRMDLWADAVPLPLSLAVQFYRAADGCPAFLKSLCTGRVSVSLLPLSYFAHFDIDWRRDTSSASALWKVIRSFIRSLPDSFQDEADTSSINYGDICLVIEQIYRKGMPEDEPKRRRLMCKLLRDVCQFHKPQKRRILPFLLDLHPFDAADIDAAFSLEPHCTDVLKFLVLKDGRRDSNLKSYLFHIALLREEVDVAVWLIGIGAKANLRSDRLPLPPNTYKCFARVMWQFLAHALCLRRFVQKLQCRMII